MVWLELAICAARFIDMSVPRCMVERNSSCICWRTPWSWANCWALVARQAAAAELGGNPRRPVHRHVRAALHGGEELLMHLLAHPLVVGELLGAGGAPGRGCCIHVVNGLRSLPITSV